MKNLVLTRADEDVSGYTKITHPIIIKYASKCNADFKILSDCKGLHKHYRILQLHDLFNAYDRIMVLDSDVLIKKSCPDLFKLVPENNIGILYEDVGTREKDRRERIRKAKEFYGDCDWEAGYINSGVAVFSKIHQDLFKFQEEKTKLWMGLGYDDVHLGWLIASKKYEIFHLFPYYNFMSMFTEEPFNLKIENAEIIHFAGMGHWPNVPKDKQIDQLYNIMSKYGEI